MMEKTALITGITGQDGSYLAELLLDKGYTVFGMKRRSSLFNTQRIDHIFDHERLHLLHGDMSDSTSVRNVVDIADPDEVYNLAAQSHVAVSFEEPEYTCDTIAMGTLRLLEACVGRDLRFYQASTSEMFGNSGSQMQDEHTPMLPVSPYGISKLYAHQLVQSYRSSYNLAASCGILFNHESPRRGETFVTRKIVRGLVRLRRGMQKEPISLGNINVRRDWGHAKDYVRAMWLMLQQGRAEDFVVATGTCWSVRQFIGLAAKVAGFNLEWGEDQATDNKYGKVVQFNVQQYLRPLEVYTLCGDASKAKEVLNWVPEYSFRQLVQEMVEHEEELAAKELWQKKKYL